MTTMIRYLRRLFGFDNPAPPKTKTDKPWRKTYGWGSEKRRDLKLKVAAMAPQSSGHSDVPFFNITLLGQIGAGKSSFLNSVSSIYQEQVNTSKAQVGETSGSLTKKYRVYRIKPIDETNFLPWRICDTMGLEPEDTHDVANILKAVDGHVPDGFQFSKEEIYSETVGCKWSPELKDKSHCVALVINANVASHMGEEMKKKLKRLRESLIAREMPMYVLLTHIDKVCEEVIDDVTIVYRSIAVRDIFFKVSKILLGLPESQILPIINYKKQTELDDNMDILLLTALRQMLGSAQGYLDNKVEIA